MAVKPQTYRRPLSVNFIGEQVSQKGTHITTSFSDVNPEDGGSTPLPNRTTPYVVKAQKTVIFAVMAVQGSNLPQHTTLRISATYVKRCMHFKKARAPK